MGYSKYKVNHEYFENIDSENKAYFLGLLYADGCIYQPKGNRQLTTTIALQEGDEEVLKVFSKEVAGGQGKMFNSPSIAKNNWKKKFVVKIASNCIGNSLINLGCGIRKSSEGMKFPIIDEKYYFHFIRGFLDGDGSVLVQKVNYRYKRKTSWFLKNAYTENYKLRIAFSSTDRQFLLKIADILEIKNPYIKEKLRTKIVYTFWIERIDDTTRVLNSLYKDATIFLKRKHDKFLEYNKIIKSRAENRFSEGLTTT